MLKSLSYSLFNLRNHSFYAGAVHLGYTRNQLKIRNVYLLLEAYFKKAESSIFSFQSSVVFSTYMGKFFSSEENVAVLS